MQTWSNKADALIQLAGAYAKSLAPVEAWPRVREAIERAHDAYLQATSLSSSDNGDDLPGLLCNWGTGFLSAAEAMAPLCLEGKAMARELLATAEIKLQVSLDFDRCDVQVCC
jgi:hypothetical protein